MEGLSILFDGIPRTSDSTSRTKNLFRGLLVFGRSGKQSNHILKGREISLSLPELDFKFPNFFVLSLNAFLKFLPDGHGHHCSGMENGLQYGVV